MAIFGLPCRRKIIGLLFVACIVSTLQLNAITFDEARHLLSRTGFGGTPTEIERLLPLDYQAAVSKLLSEIRQTPVVSPPKWVTETPPVVNKLTRMMLTRNNKMMMRKKRRFRDRELKQWWYREMVATDSPLTERMVLFWHNHFTSSLRKARWAPFIYRQNALFRNHAKGNFAKLLHAIAKDPAMILYLDTNSNRKGKPNENFARELLELFTLGEGNYTERDIKDAARAFTGWSINRKRGIFQFRRRLHDYQQKHFMNQQGTFDGDDIIKIILQQPRTAVYITEKLWREFISDTPNAQEVQRLANIFRSRNYEMEPLLTELFTSSYFRDLKQRGHQIKSPVELIVGTIRMFDLPVPDYRSLIQMGRLLGQDLFDPPNVKGWRGGKAWINSNTLLARKQFLRRALRGMEFLHTHFWVWHYMKNKSSRGEAGMQGLQVWMRLTHPQRVKKIQKLLLPVNPVTSLPQQVDTATVIHRITQDLAYQLK